MAPGSVAISSSAARLLARCATGLIRNLRLIKQANAFKLGYRAATHSKAYVAQVPTIESDDLLMFTLYTDDAVWERFTAMSDEDIVTWGRRKMEKLYPEIAGHFVFGHVGQQPRTACFASPGFYRRVTELFANLAPARVQLAGDLFGAGSLEAAVVWGEKAADRILSRRQTHTTATLQHQAA
jgi:protoporphyrinogen oxidase